MLRVSITSWCRRGQIWISRRSAGSLKPSHPRPKHRAENAPPYSPFLNVMERAISCLKAAIEADISLKDAWITEIRLEPEESHWGSFEHNNGLKLSETSTLQLKVHNGTTQCRPIC